MWAYENIDANMYIYIYIVIYIYTYTYITQFVEANRSSRKFGAKNPPFSITLAYCVG